MRIFEMKGQLGKLPSSAGLARIEWSSKMDSPKREDWTIILPEGDNVQFFPLLKGQQFLVEVKDRSKIELFFGGTDEKPFLVQLEHKILHTLSNGEESFFASIKPSVVTYLENMFGTRAIRQGDWFGVPFHPKFSWNDAVAFLSILGNKKLEEMETSKDGSPLKHTRHLLYDGHYVEAPFLVGRGFDRYEFLIGEGILKTPDHGDKTFKGPHAFFQTSYLVNPEKAD